MRKVLLAAVFASAPAYGQTFTQMEWGVDKTATPYNIATKVGGSWRSIGTLTSGGAFLPAFYLNTSYAIPSTVNNVCTGPFCQMMTETSGANGSYGLRLTVWDMGQSVTLASGKIVVGDTAWLTASNLSSSNQLFGGWWGANSPSQKLGHLWPSGAGNYIVGGEVNVGNRFADLGVQTDLGGTRATIGLQVVPDVIPTNQGSTAWSVSGITIGAGAVVSVANHNFTLNMGVVFAGTPPGGLTAGTTYYVCGTIVAATSFQVCASPGSASTITTSGSFTAGLTVLPSYPGTFGVAVGHSIWGHQFGTGLLIRHDTIQPAGYGAIISGNSNSATNQPFDAMMIKGYWSNGIDTSNATLTHALVMQNGQRVSWPSTYFYGTGTTLGLQQTSPTAALDLPASTTSNATLRVRTGAAPTSPNDGDLWQDGTHVYMRIGGVTKQLDN